LGLASLFLSPVVEGGRETRKGRMRGALLCGNGLGLSDSRWGTLASGFMGAKDEVGLEWSVGVAGMVSTPLTLAVDRSIHSDRILRNLSHVWLMSVAISCMFSVSGEGEEAADLMLETWENSS
jgi:hypothetical protein